MTGSNPTMKKADLAVVAIIVPICLYVFYESTKWPVVAALGRPFIIPRGVAGLLLIAVAILLYRALAGRSSVQEAPLVGADLRRVSFTAVLTFGYLPLVERLGFVLTTFSYMLLFALVLGERRWLRLLVFAVLVPLIVFALFDTTLHVPLPQAGFERFLHGHGLAAIFH